MHVGSSQAGTISGAIGGQLPPASMLPSSKAGDNGDLSHRSGLVSRRTGEPIRVLVVEDDGILSLDLTDMIEESRGETVGIATSAARAI